MGVVNGTPVNASNTNATFLNKNQADQMTFPASFTAALSLSKRDESSAATVNALTTTTVIVRITGTVTTLNGAVAPTTYADGQLLIISNASGSSVTINHESGSATAANRFALPNSALLLVPDGQAASFYYDTTSARWRPSAGSGGGGGLSAWAASFPYQTGNVVSYSENIYIALSGHTSGATFEADFASGRWDLMNTPAANRNLMAVGSNFESNTTSGWQLMTTTLTGVIPTGALTLGSAASLSVTATATNPLSGAYSLALGNVASTNIAAGQGIISQAFSVALIDQARVLATRFAYKANSNTGSVPMNFSGTSSNTWAVYIYDVTNSVWIQPAGVYNLVQSSGVGIQTGTWQTPSNMTQFRLAIVCVNATTGTTPAANAYQMYFDDFYVGPQAQASGPFISEWRDFPSVAAGTLLTATTTNPTYGTVAYNRAQWRQVGSDMEIRWDFRQTTAGTAGSGTYLFNLPAGRSIDTAKVAVSSTADDSKSLGVFDYNDPAGNAVGIGYATAYSSTQLKFVMQAQSASGSIGTVSSTYGQLSNSTLQYSLKAKVPILGWSSTVQMSNDTDTRVVAASYKKTSNQAVTGNVTDISFDTRNFDTHGAWSGSAYVAPVPGFYSLVGSMNITTVTSVNLAAFVNGTVRQIVGTIVSGNNVTIGGIVYLEAGQSLSIRSEVNITILGNSAALGPYLAIQRISGPSAIAASETVAANYWLPSNQSAGTTTPINFSSSQFDTHGAVTTGAAWKFTAPISGKYSVSAFAYASSVTTLIFVYKNGSAFLSLLNPSTLDGTGTAVVHLNAGEYIDLRPISTVTIVGGAFSGNDVAKIYIHRIGN